MAGQDAPAFLPGDREWDCRAANLKTAGPRVISRLGSSAGAVGRQATSLTSYGHHPENVQIGSKA